MHDNEHLLSQHFLFKHLDLKDIQEINKLFTERERPYKAGHILFIKGEDGQEMMLVKEGIVHIVSSSTDGKEIILNSIGVGGIIGEIALLDGKPRSAQAVVAEDCRILVIRREDFLRLLREKPDLAIRVMIVLCQKLRDTSEIVENIALNSIPNRLAKFVLKESKVDLNKIKANENIILKHTQTGIGNFIGSGRERVNKILSEWADQGIINISTNSKSITIRKPDDLKRIAEIIY